MHGDEAQFTVSLGEIGVSTGAQKMPKNGYKSFLVLSKFFYFLIFSKNILQRIVVTSGKFYLDANLSVCLANTFFDRHSHCQQCKIYLFGNTLSCQQIF